MDQLPCDCLRIIFNFVKDKDYINVTSTLKYFHSLIKYNLKIMTNQHSLSKINKVKDIYVFTNILYDFMCFYPQHIPQTIIKLTFCDNFLDDNCVTSEQIYKFKHLRKINIGMYYCNCKFIHDNILDVVNKKELTMTLITNRVFRDIFPRSTSHDKIIDDCFLRKFKRRYIENFDKYQSSQLLIENPNGIYQLTYGLIDSINRCINKENENEMCYSKKDIVGIANDYDNYYKFLVFHINKILEYLLKLKSMVCEKYEDIRLEFKKK